MRNSFKWMMQVFLLAMLLPTTASARVKQKVIDEGGSGSYKAEAREEKSFKDAVIYKPVDLQAAVARKGQLPVLVWANGGCNDTSLPHERMLNEVASRGYIVIALGSMQERIDDRQLQKSPNEQMLQAMDWIATQNSKKRSDYYGCVDVQKIGVAGQSCGGAQALSVSGDPRVKTTVMVNSGMGDIEMSGASKESLQALHAPILYMPGGESDIAYRNAVVDYSRIHQVFAAFANHLTAGHVGDFAEPYGGSFARMLTAWLDWQLKGRAEAGKVFLNNQLDAFPEWTMRSKDESKGYLNEPFSMMEVHCTNQKNQNIYGQLYLPNDGQAKKPLAILAHGYNSSFRETEAYAQTLAMNGIAAYIFDFCGGAVRSRSQGKSIEMSVFTEADDVAAIVAAARSWDFIDKDRIALLGCSQGGLVAAIASSQMPDAFRSVVLVYPALSIAEHAVTVHPKEAITSETGVDVMGMPLSHVYYDRLVGYKIFDEMKKYQGPVMIVYGDKDPIAAGDYIERARQSYRQCEINVVPGGAHGFPASITHVQANDHIVRFLKRTLLK
ncbi:MAG: prolyl oligopeptidase family serine peptidase [Bacteroidaceae bacterium]|nr:prolyl oligopeptidase family serine peptidase [Bacteroidaceae bacterium]